MPRGWCSYMVAARPWWLPGMVRVTKCGTATAQKACRHDWALCHSQRANSPDKNIAGEAVAIGALAAAAAIAVVAALCRMLPQARPSPTPMAALTALAVPTARQRAYGPTSACGGGRRCQFGTRKFCALVHRVDVGAYLVHHILSVLGGAGYDG